MRLLDSDIIIDIQRGHAPAVAWFSTLTELPCVSSLAVMELIQDAQNKTQVEQVLKIIKPLPIVFASEADQQRALEDYKSFHLSHNLGLLDALIAATAIGLGATLCTFNLKHYRVIPGLVTEQPYSRTP
jgi:predicted nucleic acid-binding protein